MKIIGKLKEGFKPIVNVIVPKGKMQWRLVSGFFLVFVAFTLLFCAKHGYGTYDQILNYDVFLYLKRFAEKNIGFAPFYSYRHPCFNLFLFPIICFCRIIKILFGVEFAGIASMMFYNAITALSINIIYKYCTDLLKITNRSSFLVCLVFACFAHVLLLSFLPESFQLSMFGLLVLIYLITNNILTGKRIPLFTNIILCVYISGITISNGMKWLVSQMFYKDTFKNKRRTIFLSGITCLVLFSLSFLVTYIARVLYFGKWNMDNNTLDFVSAGKSYIISEMLFDPILFHHNYIFLVSRPEQPFVYHSVFPVITGIVFYFLLVVSIWINRKEKPVYLLLSFLGVDIFIHLVCGFGISALYIYCLHWLFVFPILLGWLYKKIQGRKIKISFDILLIALCVTFAINNIPRLMELFI